MNISVLEKGRERSVIGTGALSLSPTTLFSVTSGQLEVKHAGIDHNSKSSSLSAFVVSDGSGSLSLEDMLISSSVSGTNVISSSIFVMALSQLRMSGVMIENMKISQLLFSEPSSAVSTSGESVLEYVTVRNVTLTGEDGVVIARA
ncbi:uncharacterized protein MONOS_17394 [Monocercomonoides exilis]|nr:hypothetical protein MONOS_17394 [Monocercomonoides exilis]